MYNLKKIIEGNSEASYGVFNEEKRLNSIPLSLHDAQIFVTALNDAEMLKADLKDNKKGTILAEANDLIYGDRAAAYGPVTISFERIAQFWSIIAKTDITAEQVGLMMIALKMSRQISKSGRDNLVDIAGYAGCIAKMEEENTLPDRLPTDLSGKGGSKGIKLENGVPVDPRHR
jgi:hypothetical protein